MNGKRDSALEQGVVPTLMEWAGGIALVFSMVYWTVSTVLPVDMCWSATASAASRAGLL